MQSILITEVLESYKLLSKQLEKVSKHVQMDDLPIWLPNPFEQSRELAAKSLTAIWNQDLEESLPPSGIICCSKKTLEVCAKANEAKERFERAVIKIRDSAGANKSKIGMLINGYLKDASRSPEVTNSLRIAGISRLNLQASYKRIKEIDSNLRSVSWTWARNHKEIEPIEKMDAVELAKNIQNPKTKQYAIDLLAGIAPNTKLAQVKFKTNPQLKANITYWENGELRRKPIVTSNIILTADQKLPKLKWANDTSFERLTRSDAQIDPNPFIHVLNIHLYGATP